MHLKEYLYGLHFSFLFNGKRFFYIIYPKYIHKIPDEDLSCCRTCVHGASVSVTPKSSYHVDLEGLAFFMSSVPSGYYTLPPLQQALVFILNVPQSS